jgi:hypothetical protein
VCRPFIVIRPSGNRLSSPPPGRPSVRPDLRDKAAVTYPYCFGANLLTQNFSANAVEPFWWSVYNASGIDPSSEINYPKAINISDTPVSQGQ